MTTTGIHITAIVDNMARPDLLAEHGLSFWIETAKTKVLFDTGQGPALSHNAARLNIRLDEAQAVVLSHGHYDHTGGLPHVLGQNSHAPVLLHPAALHPRFSRHADRTMHAIGMRPEIVQSLKDLGPRIVWTTKPVEIAPGIHATGPIPRATSFENTGGDFFLDTEGKVSDPIPDDQALWLETPEGVIVILGCAHSGVVNTLNYIARLTGAQAFHAVIGGMHLNKASPARMAATAEAFSRYKAALIAPGHCTGPAATVFLSEQLPGRVKPCRSGETFVF